MDSDYQPAGKSDCIFQATATAIAIVVISALGSTSLIAQHIEGALSAASVETDYVFDVPTSTNLKQPYATGLHAGARGISGPHDLDNDGKAEVLITDYSGGGRVHVIENGGADTWLHVYSTPWWDSAAVNTNARAVGGGDMDDDGKGEIYFFAGNGYSESNPNIGQLPVGMYVYEFTGTDNDYGAVPASIFTFPVGTPDGWRLEVITIEDIDGDGDEELLFGNSAHLDENDNWYILSVDGDIGSGTEIWNIEVRLSTRSTEAFDPVDRGGGSPYAIVPADLDGDGVMDLSLHSYNNFNLTNGTVVGPDTYTFPDAAAFNRFYHAASIDDYSLAGGVAVDINADGDEEVFYPSHHTSALFLLNYESGENVLEVTSANAVALPFAEHGRFGIGAGNVVGDPTPEVLITALYQASEINQGLPASYLRYLTFGGGNPEQASNYEMHLPDITQWFDAELFDRVVSDSLGSITTVYQTATPLGAPFAVKAAYLGDADLDGSPEVAMVFQGINDTVTVTNRVWNGASWDENQTRSAVPVRPFMRIISFPELPPSVSAKVFLEGPYLSGSDSMSANVSTNVPLGQPYDGAEYTGTPLEHAGTESVTSIPDGVVDWILVQLRTGDPTDPPMTTAATRAAFLNARGEIVDLNGVYPVSFTEASPAEYYLVVRHRNHIGVLSAGTLDLSSGTGSWDFTTAMSQAYSVGGNPMKDLGDGNFGMFACDANADGQVTAPDFNLWNASTTAGATGYLQPDCNMDAQVTAPDFNLWNANTTAGAASKVPD